MMLLLLRDSWINKQLTDTKDCRVKLKGGDTLTVLFLPPPGGQDQSVYAVLAKCAVTILLT